MLGRRQAQPVVVVVMVIDVVVVMVPVVVRVLFVVVMRVGLVRERRVRVAVVRIGVRMDDHLAPRNRRRRDECGQDGSDDVRMQAQDAALLPQWGTAPAEPADARSIRCRAACQLL